jgi:hypothetical protein
MLNSRTALRSSRAIRIPSLRQKFRNVRFESSSTQKTAAKVGGSSGLVGGLVGGGVVFALGYGYYHTSG